MFKKLKLLIWAIAVVGLLILAAAYLKPTQTPSPDAGLMPTNEMIVSEPIVLSDYIRYPGDNGKTALELLREYVSEIEVQEFDFGVFVQSINGKEAGEGNFWKLFVNGQDAQVGADQLETADTDVIEWKIEPINSEINE